MDIGKTLLFQAVSCQRAHPGCVHAGVGDAGASEAAFVYCPAEDLDQIGGAFDLATNVGSMQEMNHATIARYFRFLRRHAGPEALFYCCNREHKRLLGGEVVEFTRYPWSPADRHLVDERCPWYGYQLLTRRSSRLFGLEVPRVKRYQPIRHRRLRMASWVRALSARAGPQVAP
ncbi:MAG: hypothetical protein HY553_12080 [Elusimicrobia bacterium]|nr:hypothetical protein [Elusimicrobiota bacterium]